MASGSSFEQPGLQPGEGAATNPKLVDEYMTSGFRLAQADVPGNSSAPIKDPSDAAADAGERFNTLVDSGMEKGTALLRVRPALQKAVEAADKDADAIAPGAEAKLERLSAPIADANQKRTQAQQDYRIMLESLPPDDRRSAAELIAAYNNPIDEFSRQGSEIQLKAAFPDLFDKLKTSEQVIIETQPVFDQQYKLNRQIDNARNGRLETRATFSDVLRKAGQDAEADKLDAQSAQLRPGGTTEKAVVAADAPTTRDGTLDHDPGLVGYDAAWSGVPADYHYAARPDPILSERRTPAPTSPALQLAQEARDQFHDEVKGGVDKDQAREHVRKKFEEAIASADAETRNEAKVTDALVTMSMQADRARADRTAAGEKLDAELNKLTPAERVRAKDTLIAYNKASDDAGRKKALDELAALAPGVAGAFIQEKAVYDQTAAVLQRGQELQQEAERLKNDRYTTRSMYADLLREANQVAWAQRYDREAQELSSDGRLRSDDQAYQTDRTNRAQPQARPGRPQDLAAQAQDQQQPAPQQPLDPDKFAGSAVEQFTKDLKGSMPANDALAKLKKSYVETLSPLIKVAAPVSNAALEDLSAMAPMVEAAGQLKAQFEHLDMMAISQLPPERQEYATELLQHLNSEYTVQSVKEQYMQKMEHVFPDVLEAWKLKEQKVAQAQTILDEYKKKQTAFEALVDRTIAFPQAISEALKRNGHPAEAAGFNAEATALYLRMIIAERDAGLPQ